MVKITGVYIVVLVLLFTGCGNLDNPKNERIGSVEVLVDIDSVTMKTILKNLQLAKDDTTVYGYKAYKIPYKTTDEEGNSVDVSGLMVVPVGMPDIVSKQLGYSIVSDDHGTIFSNHETSTVVAKESYAPAGSAVILTSLGGFVTLQPDYIGFGDSSDHYHPFVLKKSLANATVDFIHAAKSFASEANIKLNGQLFITGYSEGGYAAMATLQKIEAVGQIPVALAAPMSGPYAFDAMAMGVLSSPILSVPSFMANIGYAYSKAYDQDIANTINEPYALQLETLFDGSKVRQQIDAVLPKKTTGVDGLFHPAFVKDFFTNPDNWFKKAAIENNLHTWVPKSTVRLVHCKGDTVIPYVISELTQKTMLKMGAKDVEIVPVEQALGMGNAMVDHSECGMMAYRVATGMFAKIRKATVGY